MAEDREAKPLFSCRLLGKHAQSSRASFSILESAIQEVFPGAVLPEPLDMVFKYWEEVAR